VAIASRKGLFFSIIAIIMSALFIVLFSGLTHVPLDKDVTANQFAAFRVNGLLEVFDDFLESNIERSSYLTLETFVAYYEA